MLARKIFLAPPRNLEKCGNNPPPFHYEILRFCAKNQLARKICGAIFGIFALGPILLIGSSVSLLIYVLNKEKFVEQIPLGSGIASAAVIYYLILILLSNYSRIIYLSVYISYLV